jgi:hypothetical protein
MPQASEALRDLMEKWFGDRVDIAGPVAFLCSHGYLLREDWCWIKPTPSHTMSRDERSCIIFLQDEWDFGGIAIDGLFDNTKKGI